MDIIKKWGGHFSNQNMEEAVQDFIKAVKSTEEYEAYALQREKIRKYPDLKRQIDEYRTANYRLQILTDPDELFEKTDEFQKKYEAFREDPVVNEFLEAELRFCRMMQEINIKVTEAIDFD